MTSTPSARPVTQRHEAGLSRFALLLNHWLRQSGLSHEQLARLADWAGGERNLIIHSQVSHLRNRKSPRGPSLKNLEGLAAANEAIWRWQTQGEAAAVARYGPFSIWKLTPDLMETATWLPSPQEEGKPLDLVEMVLVLIDDPEMELPYLTKASLSPTDAQALSGRLCRMLNDLVAGSTPAESLARLLEAYPIKEPHRQDRLRDLLLGQEWTREELEDELYALAVLVATLRGVAPSSYGPAELHAELTAQRRRV